MKYLLVFLFSCSMPFLPKQACAAINDGVSPTKAKTPKTLLCLGDSYTIGEAVITSERFPNQTIGILEKEGIQFEKPLIIAKTGWTTQDLIMAIDRANLTTKFDRVTLLIGVNDQYQALDTGYYRLQFERLLQKALALAGYNKQHVFVLSIPDYSVTPFGGGSESIGRALDAFNQINRSVTLSYKINYIDITNISRIAREDQTLTAKDGLHPSGKQYALWADKLAASIAQSFH